MNKRPRRFPLAILLCLSAAAPTLAAPDLIHRASVVLDARPLGSDNDRKAEPGETFDFQITLGNEGTNDARNIKATLVSSDPELTVSPAPASVAFPDIAKNALATDTAPHFRLTAAPTIACGKPVALDLSLAYEDELGTPYALKMRLILFVGEPTVLASEDFDTGPGGWKHNVPMSTPGAVGNWVNAAPEFYQAGGETAQPGRDETYPDVSCFYTGQSTVDVDGGRVVLLSRPYDFAGKTNVWLSYDRFFYNDDASGGDSYAVEASNDDGLNWVQVERVSAKANAWTRVAYRLDTLLPLSATMRLRVVVEDGGLDSLCEGAIDGAEVAAYACNVDPAAATLASLTSTLNDAVNPLCTDQDQNPDAGETFDLAVVVENSGTAPATNAKATLATPLPPTLTLLGPNPVGLGTLADNGGRAIATFRVKVADAAPCQTPVVLQVTPTADAPFTATPALYPFTLEQDVNEPLLRWYDDFDSALADWSVILYGVGDDWGLQTEDCVKNPGTPPTPAVKFWYTGNTGVPTDCSASAYGAFDDSAIRTPKIDTGFVKPRLLGLRWNQLLTLTAGDADYAEVWMDHNGDGVFDKIVHFEGAVTTNGDVLDATYIDLTAKPNGVDLSNATQNVQLEFRLISDGNVGDPDSLGWIVDNVELTWTDGNGRTCDSNVCTTCQANAAVSASKTQACTAESVHLDGSASTIAGCPAPGVRVYAWFRDGLPVSSGPDFLDVQEPVAGSYDYRLDVSCSTQPGCKDSKIQKLNILDCPNCKATADIKTAPAETCANVAVLLDASASGVSNCPAPGVLSYQWSRNAVNVPAPTGTASTYTANEPIAGTYTYAVEVACSTDATCKNSQSHGLLVKPNGTPLAVPGSLRARKLGANVQLTWLDSQPLAVGWNLYRETVKSPPTALALPVAASPYSDVNAVTSPPSAYYYRLRAVSCSGIEGPDQ